MPFLPPNQLRQSTKGSEALKAESGEACDINKQTVYVLWHQNQKANQGHILPQSLHRAKR